MSLIVDSVDFAFQPIVNSKSGSVIGYEALLRNYDKAGFNSIFELFDYAYESGFLYQLDLELRKKAIDGYINGFKDGLLLFYNLDSRLLMDKNYKRGATKDYLEKLGIEPSQFVFEISERFKINDNNTIDIIRNYSRQGFKIAIDDFGVGNVCFESFYHIKPDIVKLDGFFTDNIEQDHKKKLLLEILVKLANSLGFSVIAEKVETTDQIYSLDSVGINIIQGYVVSRPKITDRFDRMLNLNVQLKRGGGYRDDLMKYALKIEPLFQSDSATKLFDLIKYGDFQYIPVVNSMRVPMFVVDVRKILKTMANSKYFSDLYVRGNKKVEDMENYLDKPAVLEITENINLEKLTNLMASNRDVIVLTENYRYMGVLTYKDLLAFVHRKKVYEAINTNPLTGLPGNLKIKEFIDENLSKHSDFVIVYFDFDNFKPFNDKYGFRVGDRVIQLFSNILSANLFNKGYFIGHIGGDDFFAGKVVKTFEDIVLDIENCVQMFKKQAVSFYDKEDITRGYMVGKDRDGNTKKFNFLSVSAAVLFINKSSKRNWSSVDKVIAELKKSAKNSSNHITMATLI